MEKTKLTEILNLHKLWLEGDSKGVKANLSGADLSWANLSRANLFGVDLSGVDLSGADLSGADLSWAGLFRANLSGADLSGANLSGANLSWADLSGANLSGANLSVANLSVANLSWARGITPSMILLASWGSVSDSLCTDLMNYDASNHPNPEAFKTWVETGECPYADGSIKRACNFTENKSLLKLKKKIPRTYDLMISLFKEKSVKYNQQ